MMFFCRKRAKRAILCKRVCFFRPKYDQVDAEGDEEMKDELREAFADILPLRLSEQAREEVCGDFKGTPKKITAAKAIALSMVSKAIRGDVKAYDIIRESVEESDGGGDFRVEITTD